MKIARRQLVFGIVNVATVCAAAGAVWIWWSSTSGGEGADPDNPSQVALGHSVYDSHCARCHGDRLQGETNWQQRKPSGRLPAPPHDASGHTWHHTDAQLIGMVKNGITPYAPAGYQSDMPAFGSILSDEQIRAVIAFIKSSWPEEIRERQKRLTDG
jgi:mono/diheme cytochrome c family protein